MPSSLFPDAWRHKGAVDPHRLSGFIAFDGRLIDCVGDFHAFGYFAKR
jgi:hypothetical protein